MKKAILVVAVLMLAAPAWGQEVMITCSCTDSNEVTVYYDMNGVEGLIRAVALDVTVDNGAVITDVCGYKVGESVEGDKGYGIFPGSIVINGSTGEVSDYGTPVGDPCEYPDITLDGIDTNGVTIEMGSLYYPVTPTSPNAPDTSGILFKFTANKDCNVTIEENAARGGVVMEDGTGAATNLPCSLCCQSLVCGSCPWDCSSWSPGVPDAWVGPEDVAYIIDIIDDYAGSGYYCNTDGSDPSCAYPCLDVSSWQPGVPDGWLGPEDVAYVIDIIDDYPEMGYYVDCTNPNLPPP